MRAVLIAVLALATASVAPIASGAGAQGLGAAAQSILGADQGVYVEAADGTILLSQAAAVAVHPASVSKVPTTLALLRKLGPEHRFITTFTAKGRVVDGTLYGDLIVASDGDPSLVDEDALLVAERLRQSGITRVSGTLRLKGPLTFDWKTDSDGASLRRALSGVTPPAALAAVRALEVLNSTADTAGSPASGTTLAATAGSSSGSSPGLAATAGSSSGSSPGLAATAESSSGSSPGLVATAGSSMDTSPASAVTAMKSVSKSSGLATTTSTQGANAATFATTRALAPIGIHFATAAALAGGTVAGPGVVEFSGERPLIVHRSQPLLPLAKSLNDYSNNIFAPFAEAAGGAAAVESLARSVVPEQMRSEITLGDGAGENPTNRLSPRAAVKLLRVLEQELAKSGHALYDILPVAGVDDGTLRDRLNGPGEAGHVLGKTGTFGDYGASALIGAIRTTDMGTVYFAILNHNVPVPQARHRQDRFVRFLLTQLHTVPWSYQRDPRPAITRADVSIMLP